MLLSLLCVSGLLSLAAVVEGQSVSNDVVVMNEAVDQLLDSAKLALRLKGSNKIPMKNIEKTFKTKIFGIEVPGKFATSAGYLEDLASLHRTGDVTMSTEGNTLKLRASMGFGLLHVFFNHYDFSYLSVASSGTMEVKTEGAAASATISVVRSGDKCVVSVDSASLDSMGKASAQLTGSSVLNKFVTMLLNFVLENFNDVIQKVANTKMTAAMREGLTKVDLCSKLPH